MENTEPLVLVSLSLSLIRKNQILATSHLEWMCCRLSVLRSVANLVLGVVFVIDYHIFVSRRALELNSVNALPRIFSPHPPLSYGKSIAFKALLIALQDMSDSFCSLPISEAIRKNSLIVFVASQFISFLRIVVLFHFHRLHLPRSVLFQQRLHFDKSFVSLLGLLQL